MGIGFISIIIKRYLRCFQKLPKATRACQFNLFLEDEAASIYFGGWRNMKSFCSCHILKIFPSSGLFDVPNGPGRSYFIISIRPAADTNPDRKDSKWLLGKVITIEILNYWIDGEMLKINFFICKRSGTWRRLLFFIALVSLD